AGGDRNCIWELRMILNAFANWHELLQVQGGLDEDGHVGIGEQIATFLIIIAAYKLGFIDPVPKDCIDPRWKSFKGCLGALDGTHINVTVPNSDKSRYETRKSRISTNVLGVCNRNMNFVYVLSSWEGLASDSRVRRDAITQHNGLKIPVVSIALLKFYKSLDIYCVVAVIETKQFVVFMEELDVEGKRADADQFKPGAFQKLGDKMNEKFSGCGLTVKHIRNKHKRLKEKYMYVAEMLGCRGFGWNSEKMCVEVDSKQVLEAWGK
ncbi:hypothetical protein S83_001359, partial [Arachis hypogaea]